MKKYIINLLNEMLDFIVPSIGIASAVALTTKIMFVKNIFMYFIFFTLVVITLSLCLVEVRSQIRHNNKKKRLKNKIKED